MPSSARIQEIILETLSDLSPHNVQELKQQLDISNEGNYTEGQFAGSLNTLQRNGKIKKIDRGVYMINNQSGDSVAEKKCFIISPIGDAGSDIRAQADKVLKHIIQPVCSASGFTAIRVDQINDSNSITETVIEELEQADLVIADITGHNPNVFYEIGYRSRAKKPIIHLKAKGESLPFDIAAIRTFEYDLMDLDNVEEIKNRLAMTIETMSFEVRNQTEDPINTPSESNAMLPLLYQIIDAISDLRGEIKDKDTETMQTVIKSLQSTQPQMSAEVALQTQLMGALLQNPDSFTKIMELSGKLPQNKRP